MIVFLLLMVRIIVVLIGLGCAFVAVAGVGYWLCAREKPLEYLDVVLPSICGLFAAAFLSLAIIW
jgi:hypothetical protein